MNLEEAEARLKAKAPDFRLVKGAAEFAALKDNPPKAKQPACYLIPIADTAGPNRLINGVRQQVTERFAAVLARGNLRDPRGEGATKAIRRHRDAGKTAFLGWEPESATGQVVYAGGRALGLRDGVVWWHDEYAVTDHIRSTSS